jgi:hypothetical protein
MRLARLAWLVPAAILAVYFSGAALADMPASADADLGASLARGELPASIKEVFSGDWRGKGVFATGREVASEINFTPAAGNAAIEFHYSDAPPNNTRFVALLTVDTARDALLLMMAGNNSAGGRAFRCLGWHEAKLVFVSTPDLSAKFAHERFTFWVHDNRHMTLIYDYGPDGETWREGDRQDFERRS